MLSPFGNKEKIRENRSSKDFIRHYNLEIETLGNAEDVEDVDFYDYTNKLRKNIDE